jgi:hypothetical protein
MSELSRRFDEIFAKLRVLSIVGTPLDKHAVEKRIPTGPIPMPTQNSPDTN